MDQHFPHTKQFYDIKLEHILQNTQINVQWTIYLSLFYYTRSHS